PVVYECLDVHRLLVRRDPIGFGLRGLERFLLKRCRALVVSSPGFLRNYFDVYHGGLFQAHLLENRLVDGMAYGPRPDIGGVSQGRPLRIGWYGILRCARSLNLLTELASRLGNRVEIHLHGRVADLEIPDFHDRIAPHANVTFFGAYKAPEDLARIYGEVDVVWAGDFMEAGFNSVWLLPNRLYEGGYYGVPAIAPAGTETAAWLLQRDAGFNVAEPLHKTLESLVLDLDQNREKILQKRKNLLDLPDTAFVQPAGTVRELIAGISTMECKR
ncbi:MAG: glycosyl transferase, partial [Pseudomonadota bacterium]